MPDGYAFELKVAERMRKLGWACDMTPGSGDFGADLLCRSGDEFIVIQCKCYQEESSIGVGAIQEVCTAVHHFGASRGLVVYEGRLSKSARTLAHSVGVMLFHADELVSGWHYDRTAEGTALRLRQRAEHDAVVAMKLAQAKADEADRYRLDYDIYLRLEGEWKTNLTAWELRSKSWNGGWAGGAGLSAALGVLVLFSGGPSSDALLGLGLITIGAAIFFTRYPWEAPVKPTLPTPTRDMTPNPTVGPPCQRTELTKVIVRCSRCKVRLRVPAARQLRIRCPECGLSEVRATPF